ncbi:hypothetical protein IT401_02635 [Candidatus Nomurabacteria bacterium]|nr:hypothetical protein [Candidatus Nomurabacteria bacterium]
MEKFIQENSFDKDREDDIRINKNDVNKRKRTGRGFVPLEEIPETDLAEEAIESVEESDIKDYYTREDKMEIEDSTRAYEHDKKRVEQLTHELKYREGDGTASIYTNDEVTDNRPARKPTMWRVGKKSKKEEEFSNVIKEIIPRVSRRKIDDPIKSMSPQQVNRKTRSLLLEIEKWNRKRTSLNGKDNLKTIPEFKKHKNWRQKIKDFFMKQNDEDKAV